MVQELGGEGRGGEGWGGIVTEGREAEIFLIKSVFGSQGEGRDFESILPFHP